MKRLTKCLLIFLSTFLLSSLIAVVFFILTTKDYHIENDKLINSDNLIIFYDSNNKEICTSSNGKEFVSIDEIPIYTKNAFISIEDKRFYNHNGVDYKGVLRALKSNLTHSKIKEGGSTITQQLIKNTHLSNEKTIKRKLAEIKLSYQLEKKYSKDKILEMYLNTIYFGENCYGLSSASKHYFNKEVKDLTINESATLAAIIKSPTYYSPIDNPENNFKRKKIILSEMLKQGYISKNEHEKNINILSPLVNNDNLSNSLKKFLIKNATQDSLNFAYSKIANVYTTIDRQVQNELEKTVKKIKENINKTIIITDNNSNIIAYYSDVPETKRQVGSIIKPIGVYAPAIELGVIHSCTKINDYPTNFNGYQPKNYKNAYSGEISVKNALAKSSNIVAVKVASYLGVENMTRYLNKMKIYTTKDDENLSLALGSIKNGATLKEISSAYSVFMNKGNYHPEKVIKKISINGKTVKSNLDKTSRVFSEDTTFIMNDMLKETVLSGTAKRLKQLDIPLCAKTGTVGNSNGNTDAYCVSYNNSYKISVWFGNYDGSLMNNSITGGTLPVSVSYDLWKCLSTFKELKDFESCASVQKLKIDKIAYDKNNIIRLADDLAPKRYIMEEYFRENFYIKEKSTAFSYPNIENTELLVNNNRIIVRLCLIENIDYIIYRSDKNKKIQIYDSKNSLNKSEYIDDNFKPNTTYTYYVLPYYFDGYYQHFGDEILLGKIKSPSIKLGDNMWIDDDL